MKLKSILILAMVAIMAMAGGAMAATTTTTGTGSGVGGASFGHTFTMFGCSGGLNGSFGPGATTLCTSPLMWTAAGATALVTNSNAATDGTGAGGTFPANVAFNPATGQYTSNASNEVGGFELDQNLYGMCATNLGTSCNRFIPLTAVTGAVGVTAKIAAAIGNTIPVGTDSFNQGTFITGLVSGFAEAAGGNAVTNELSQRTSHHALTNVGGDGDYIDQRLAVQVTNSTATGQSIMNQQLRVVAGSSGTFTVNAAGVDANWVGNIDPFNAPYSVAGLAQNGGEIRQVVTDNMAGQEVGGVDIGSYGQSFNNSDSVTAGPNLSNPTAPGAPGITYNTSNVSITGVTP